MRGDFTYHKYEELNVLCSPLRTYNTLNNLTYTLHTPLKQRILHANTLLIYSMFYQSMPLHTYKVQNFTY